MDIAVIGGGFSGTMLVCHLLEHTPAVQKIIWFEQGANVARGIAYGTSELAHVLNVSAQGMSAFPSAPGHLLTWLRQRSAAGEGQPFEPDAFVPRKTYGRYLTACLDEATAAHPHRLNCVHKEVIGMAPPAEVAAGCWELSMADGSRCHAAQVALATGHFAPMAPRVPGLMALPPHLYIADPWDYAAIARVGSEGHIATLGAGLSMVDVFLQLSAQGFGGQLTAVSRHGLWPHAHATKPSAIALTPPSLVGLTAAALVAWLRGQIGAHVAKGGDWRQVIDGLRPHTRALWQALTAPDQRRVQRHVKSLWDAHRHRVAPEVGRALAQARHRGGLVHHAGRLERAEPIKTAQGKSAVKLTWRLRHTRDIWQQQADVLINCTGAHNVWPRATTRLPRALLTAGIVQPGPHNLGLALTGEGQVVGSKGTAQAGLWALGPARLGQDFESVAVPELREQARALALTMARIQPAMSNKTS